jgi:hypothetical protein
VRTRGGRSVWIERDGMIDVALRELGARLVSVGEMSGSPPHEM